MLKYTPDNPNYEVDIMSPLLLGIEYMLIKGRYEKTMEACYTRIKVDSFDNFLTRLTMVYTFHYMYVFSQVGVKKVKQG